MMLSSSCLILVMTVSIESLYCFAESAVPLTAFTFWLRRLNLPRTEFESPAMVSIRFLTSFVNVSITFLRESQFTSHILRVSSLARKLSIDFVFPLIAFHI